MPKPEECLKMRQNPTSQVHALLGNLLAYQNAGEKRHHRKHDKILDATFLFTKTKRHNQRKRLL
ncbi:MAG: hypothetical protein K8S20_05110 [Chloroflexi bacterium]|nr:hypothetical protein [Chloroflexota bacterium]